ncbi:Holliday junction branch migration protein RuvA, partial [Clostridiaceae bacterium HSG29]|nr:Holliday junction branch migration protein RuvA [Clostridiaceae bacterium HSG29]
IRKVDLDYIVMENNNIGYKINTSKSTIDDIILIAKDEMVLINTVMVVREDDISLFGFFTEDELDVFNLLRTVSNVGAKSAIRMLSGMHYMEIVNIIKNNDHKSLTKAKGVGTKTAKRIIIDLNEKMDKRFPEVSTVYEVKKQNAINPDAIEALMALGYSQKESENVLNEFDNKNLSVEELIKKALSYF